MPFSNIIKSNINRKFSLQFSTPTEDIFNIQTTLKYLNQDATYSLIPGIQNTCLLDPQRLLLQILPFTTNCIVDITMPFIQVTKNKTILRHLGRYIICDRKLLAIRIKPSDNWPKSKTIKKRISPNLENFYHQNGIENYEKEITVGQFLIMTQHFKLAPLFTSELSSLLDNTTINLLNDYYNLGCQIFSIVNDLTEDKKKSLKEQPFYYINHSPFEIIKNYRRESTVVVCCGVHLAIDPNEIYKMKSYAIQTSDRLKRIHVTRLDQVYTEQFIADLNQTKKARKICLYDDSLLISSDIQIIDCRNFRLKHYFENIDFNAIEKFEQPMDVEEIKDETTIKENDLLLYLWNLFLNVNNRRPFIFPCPMNNKDEALLKKVLQLEKFSNLKKSDLVEFLKLDSKAKIPKKYEIYNFKVLNLQRLTAFNGQRIPIYFSLKERITMNNIDKDERFFFELEKKVINCSLCINQEILKNIENQSIVEQIQVTNEDQKFIERFLKRKAGYSLQLFYFEMARYYPHSKLTSEFMLSMFKCLKLKIQKEFSGTPFNVYIVKSSFEDVRHIFAESEEKYFFKGINGIKNEEDQNQGEKNQAQQNNFRVFIKKVNYHINNQKKANHSCHICNSLFNKKDKCLYGRLCLGCNNFVCYSCFDKKTGQLAQSEDQFQYCLICQNKCDCQKCIKKKLKNQELNEFTPSKNTFFKSNKLNNSTENIQTNEEENFPNVGKNPSSIFSQSELEVKKSFQYVKNFKIQMGAEAQQIRIQPCWTCELQNRVQRIIKFECSQCKMVKCLECQKSQNSKRIWALRGHVLCNNCNGNQKSTVIQQTEIKMLKNKIIALEYDLNLAKRQNILSSIPMTSKNNDFDKFQIVEQTQQNDSKSFQQHRVQKGSVTPLFDCQNQDSPMQYTGKNNISESGSIASFGGNKYQTKTQKQSHKRKNSSNSSGSKSIQSKKSSKNKKQNVKIQLKLKYSSESQKQSLASFKNKQIKARSNSSRSSKVSEKFQGKKSKISHGSSAESGEYQISSSSSQKSKEIKRDWKKNTHQNDNQKNQFNIARGKFRSRGRGRGGSFQTLDRKWDNRDNQRNFKYKKDDKWGSTNNRFNNDKADYQGGYKNNKQRYQNLNNERSYESNYENKNNQDQRQKNDENKEGFIFSMKNRSNTNNQDFDY